MRIRREDQGDGKQVILHVKGEFNFTLVQEIREAYADLKSQEVVVDL